MNASRVSTAAATASVVPFHCVICFEEFNLELRFPVVLPCGHTFVCNCCARRLRRCMECREPLFWTALTAGAAANSSSSTSSGQVVPKTPPTSARAPPRYQRRYQAPSSPGPSTSSPAAESVPLPLPKNLVLMAMMEAAERQQAQERKQRQQSQDDDIVDDENDEEEEEEEEDVFDLNRIISGMVTFTGPCGTYAVRDPDGLTVLPSQPNVARRSPQPSSAICLAEVDNDESKDAIKRAAQIGVEETAAHGAPAFDISSLEETTTNSVCTIVDAIQGDVPYSETRENSSEHHKEPFHIAQGQTVQVVDFADGVAKLARGAGFILATSSQLVKVGGPLDRCCRLEGVLDTFVLRGRDLKRALDENLKIEADLRMSIACEIELPADYPIITGPREHDEMVTPEHHKPGAAAYDKFRAENPPLLPRSPREVVVTEASDSPGMELVGELGDFIYNPNPTYQSSPNSIDNSDINHYDTTPGMPRYRRNSEDDLNAFAYGCGSALFGKGFLNFNHGSDHRMALSYSIDEDPQAMPQPRLPDSALAQHIGTPPPPIRQTAVSSLMSAATPMLSNSFDAVDWRTGMSCHRGLSKTSPRSTLVNRTSVRMMSEHRGIGSSRVPPRQPNSLAPPFPSAYYGHADEKF